MTSYRKLCWFLDHETNFFGFLGHFYFGHGPAIFPWTNISMKIKSIFICDQGTKTCHFLQLWLQWRHLSRGSSLKLDFKPEKRQIEIALVSSKINIFWCVFFCSFLFCQKFHVLNYWKWVHFPFKKHSYQVSYPFHRVQESYVT